MLMPDPEPPKHLQRAEVSAALVRFTQDAGEMARAKKLARILANGLPAMDAEDLLHKAFILLLAGSRSWKRELPAFVVISGVMKSVASNTRKKADYFLAEDFVAPSDEDSGVESSPLAEGVSPESDPARAVEAEFELIAIQNSVKGNEDLELYVEALAEGLTGMDIAKELSWDEKKYDAVRKQFSRRLAKLKTDRN